MPPHPPAHRSTHAFFPIPFARMAAIKYLYEHVREQPALQDMAAHVHVSPAHLQRQFQ